jgi:hypothetical protein
VWSLKRCRMVPPLLLLIAIFVAAGVVLPQRTGVCPFVMAAEKGDLLVPETCDPAEPDFQDCVAQSRKSPRSNSGIPPWLLLIAGIVFGFLLGRATTNVAVDKAAVKTEIDDAFKICRGQKINDFGHESIFTNALDRAEKEVKAKLKKLNLLP